jgi:hypothetical protein
MQDAELEDVLVCVFEMGLEEVMTSFKESRGVQELESANVVDGAVIGCTTEVGGEGEESDGE